MNGKVLATWMKKLQDEFENRMAAIDADAASAMDESEGESDVGTEVEAGNEAEVQVEDPSTSPDGGGRHGGSDECMDRSPEQRFEMTGALQSETGEEG